MNLIQASGTFVAKGTSESGINCLKLTIPVQNSKAAPAPVYLIATRAAGETFVPDAFKEGTQILFTGRLYPNKNEGRMYVAPTGPLQVVHPELSMNHVTVAGGVGYIAEERREDLFSCGLLCNAPKQKLLHHDWDDSVGFKLEAWGDDAVRLRKYLYKGRQIAACGSLRYETWEGKEGTQSAYKVRTRAGHFALFGKNKPSEQTLPIQQSLDEAQPAPTITLPAVESTVPKEDNIPF